MVAEPWATNAAGRAGLDAAAALAVTITIMRPFLAALLFLASSARAQDLGTFEKILFPVLSAASLHGANDTSFQTRLQAFTPEPVAFYPTPSNANASFGAQPAGIDFVRFFEATPHAAGRLLYFDRTGADKLRLFFELAVTGHDGSVHRSTLPVVRERSFEHGASTILGLTTGPKYDFSGGLPPKVIGFNARNHVRIYDVDNTGALVATVQVTVPGLEAYGPFARYELPVTARDAEDPSYPYYADISLPDLCITAPTGSTCNDYPLTVSIELSDPNARYWAFASATDNISGETGVFFAQ